MCLLSLEIKSRAIITKQKHEFCPLEAPEMEFLAQECLHRGLGRKSKNKNFYMCLLSLETSSQDIITTIEHEIRALESSQMEF